MYTNKKLGEKIPGKVENAYWKVKAKRVSRTLRQALDPGQYYLVSLTRLHCGSSISQLQIQISASASTEKHCSYANLQSFGKTKTKTCFLRTANLCTSGVWCNHFFALNHIFWVFLGWIYTNLCFLRVVCSLENDIHQLFGLNYLYFIINKLISSLAHGFAVFFSFLK